MNHFAIYDLLGWRLRAAERFVADNPNHEDFPSELTVQVGKDCIIFELPTLPSYSSLTRYDRYDHPQVNLVSIVGFSVGERFSDQEVESLAYAPVAGDPFTNLRVSSTAAGEAICLVADFLPNGLTLVELDAILVRFMDETTRRAKQIRSLLELVNMESKRGSFSRGVANNLSDLERQCLEGIDSIAKRPRLKLSEV